MKTKVLLTLTMTVILSVTTLAQGVGEINLHLQNLSKTNEFFRYGI